MSYIQYIYASITIFLQYSSLLYQMFLR